jgi:hypothetical protein
MSFVDQSHDLSSNRDPKTTPRGFADLQIYDAHKSTNRPKLLHRLSQHLTGGEAAAVANEQRRQQASQFVGFTLSLQKTPPKEQLIPRTR